MFAFKKNQDQPVPALPASERGCIAHRVKVTTPDPRTPHKPDHQSIAYVFTVKKNLKDAVFHASNVVFVDPETTTPSEQHDIDSIIMDEGNGDYDYHAAEACMAMTLRQHEGQAPKDADKVVVFNQTSCPHDIVDSLCETFRATSHSDSKRPEPEQPKKPTLRIVPATTTVPQDFHYSC
jgi:hypothetical protein